MRETRTNSGSTIPIGWLYIPLRELVHKQFEETGKSEGERIESIIQDIENSIKKNRPKHGVIICSSGSLPVALYPSVREKNFTLHPESNAGSDFMFKLDKRIRDWTAIPLRKPPFVYYSGHCDPGHEDAKIFTIMRGDLPGDPPIPEGVRSAEVQRLYQEIDRTRDTVHLLDSTSRFSYFTVINVCILRQDIHAMCGKPEDRLIGRDKADSLRKKYEWDAVPFTAMNTVGSRPPTTDQLFRAHALVFIIYEYEFVPQHSPILESPDQFIPYDQMSIFKWAARTSNYADFFAELAKYTEFSFFNAKVDDQRKGILLEEQEQFIATAVTTLTPDSDYFKKEYDHCIAMYIKGIIWFMNYLRYGLLMANPNFVYPSLFAPSAKAVSQFLKNKKVPESFSVTPAQAPKSSRLARHVLASAISFDDVPESFYPFTDADSPIADLYPKSFAIYDDRGLKCPLIPPTDITRIDEFIKTVTIDKKYSTRIPPVVNRFRN